MMHCPSCGSQASEQQKFCRACGMNLDGLAERVAAQQGIAPVKLNAEPLPTTIGKWIALGGMGVMVLTVMIALLSVAFGLLSEATLALIMPKLFAIGFSAVVTGGGTMIVPKLLQKERGTAQNQPLPDLTTRELPPPVSSITEATTRNLEAVAQEHPNRARSSDLTGHAQ